MRRMIHTIGSHTGEMIHVVEESRRQDVTAFVRLRRRNAARFESVAHSGLWNPIVLQHAEEVLVYLAEAFGPLEFPVQTAIEDIPPSGGHCVVGAPDDQYSHDL